MKFTFNTIDPITGQDLNNISGDEKNFVRTEIRKHLAAQGKETLEAYGNESFTATKSYNGEIVVTWDKMPSQTFLAIG
jgi:hypothetical protein